MYKLVTNHISNDGGRFGRHDFGEVETRAEAQSWVDKKHRELPKSLLMEAVAYGPDWEEVRPVQV